MACKLDQNIQLSITPGSVDINGAGNHNDIDLGGQAATVVANNPTITGMVAVTGGRLHATVGVGPGSNPTFINQSGLSSANNRFATQTLGPTSTTVRLMWYDPSTLRWRLALGV